MAARQGGVREDVFDLSQGVITDISDLVAEVVDAENLLPPMGGQAGRIECRRGVQWFDVLTPSAGSGAVVFNCYPGTATGQSANIGAQVLTFIVARGSGRVMASQFQTSRQGGTSIYFDPGNRPY